MSSITALPHSAITPPQPNKRQSNYYVTSPKDEAACNKLISQLDDVYSGHYQVVPHSQHSNAIGPYGFYVGTYQTATLLIKKVRYRFDRLITDQSDRLNITQLGWFNREKKKIELTQKPNMIKDPGAVQHFIFRVRNKIRINWLNRSQQPAPPIFVTQMATTINGLFSSLNNRHILP